MGTEGSSFQSLDSSVLELENGLVCVCYSAWSLRALPQGGMGTD